MTTTHIRRRAGGPMARLSGGALMRADGSIDPDLLDAESAARESRAGYARALDGDGPPAPRPPGWLLRRGVLAALLLVSLGAAVALTFQLPIVFQGFLAALGAGRGTRDDALLLFAMLVASYAAVNAVFALSFRLGLEVRRHFVGRALRLVDAGTDAAPGRLVAYFGHEIGKLQDAASVLPMLLLNLGISVVSTVLLVRFNGALGLVAIAALLVATVLTEALARRNAALSQRLNRCSRTRAEATTSIFTSMRTIIQAGLIGNAAGLIAKRRRDEVDVLLQRTTSLTWLNLLMQLVPIGLSFAVVLPGLVSNGSVDTAVVFPSLLMLGTLRSAMGALPDLVDALTIGVQVLRDVPRARRDGEGAGAEAGLAAAVAGLRGRIVHVRGDDAALASFLAAVDGIGPVHYLSDRAWVHSGTVREYVGSGSGPVDPLRLQLALAHSCLQGDLAQLRHGVDTALEAGGANLSGGQRQRLAIARAVYDDAAVVVARNAFSALDGRTRGRVLAACLGTAWAGRTVFLLDEDPAVLRHAQVRLDVDATSGTTISRLDPQAPVAEAAPAVERIGESASAGTGLPPSAPAGAASAAGSTLTAVFGKRALWLFLATALAAVLFRDGLLLASQYVMTTASGAAVTRHISFAVLLMAVAAVVTALMVRHVLAQVVEAMDRVFARLMASTLYRKLNRIESLDRYLAAGIQGQGMLDQSLGPRLVGVLATAGFLATTVLFVSALLPAMLPLFAAMFLLMHRLGRNYRRTVAALAGAENAISGTALGSVVEFVDGREVLRLRRSSAAWLQEQVIPGLARHDAAISVAERAERWFSLRMEILSSLMFLCVALWLGRAGGVGPVIDGLILVTTAAAITASGRLVKTLAFFDHDMVWLRRSLALIDPPSATSPATLADASQAIAVHGLRFRYGHDEKPALSLDALAIRAGESVAVVGRTGSGKSTLLKLLSGVLEPTAGSIRVAGLEPSALSAQDYERVFRIVPQEPVLLPGPLRDSFFPAALADADVASACARAGVDAHVRALLDAPAGARLGAHATSRLVLASIAASVAPVVVLDEPTAALDATAARDFTVALLEIAAGRTVVMVTHNPRLVDCFDRCVELGPPAHPPSSSVAVPAVDAVGVDAIPT